MLRSNEKENEAQTAASVYTNTKRGKCLLTIWEVIWKSISVPIIRAHQAAGSREGDIVIHIKKQLTDCNKGVWEQKQPERP